jgi:hypothetical protein
MQLNEHPDFTKFLRYDGICFDIFIENGNSFQFVGSHLKKIREELKLTSNFGCNTWTSPTWVHKIEVSNRLESCAYFPLTNMSELTSNVFSKILNSLSNLLKCRRQNITFGVLLSEYIEPDYLETLEKMFKLLGLKITLSRKEYVLLKEIHAKEITLKEITL